jgi:hypothetical protein
MKCGSYYINVYFTGQVKIFLGSGVPIRIQMGSCGAITKGHDFVRVTDDEIAKTAPLINH